MGGEGAMMQANQLLRNNSRRHKRDPFNNKLSNKIGATNNFNKGIPSEPLSEECLQTIRTKLRLQNTREKRVQFLIFGIALLLLSVSIMAYQLGVVIQ